VAWSWVVLLAVGADGEDAARACSRGDESADRVA
jgi:hypothetical protein